jgi:Ca-activated chloride channel family protein
MLILTLLLTSAGLAQGHGLLIPVEKTLPPLALLHHRVNVSLEDQVAVTNVEQVFRNHTSRPLEATYVFPVPRGASVREFAMWVDGKRLKGELVEAAKAKQIYTDIVRRTLDPGLLEYLGTDLLQLKVFPVPAQGDQKIELSYTALAKREQVLVEYSYPLRTDLKTISTLEDFTLKLTLKSQQPILNIYSPTHALTINRVNDREAVIGFEKNQALLDQDFRLFYTLGGKDVGLTLLLHRPQPGEDGFFLLLLSPRPELAKAQQVPRDLVLVLDTSGSMKEDGKLEQAKKALKYCLSGLSTQDRFALHTFATTVNAHENGLLPATPERIARAKQWIDQVEAAGGTAIEEALQAALALRSPDEGRSFTILFLTDGKPTIGETNPDKILAQVVRKNTANTRIFSFGVGNDLNATFLDQLAEQTRAASTYVRPGEDLEINVSSFFEKIRHPVLADLKLATGSGIYFREVYPPQLPDLFHGGQLVVLGRYQGAGDTSLRLTGHYGKETREFVYPVHFHAKVEGKSFVEDLWARRKVGYLLEQIRLNGEKKELVEEATALAKKYGIATPYTSYLVVPDQPIPITSPRPPIRPPLPRPIPEPLILSPATPGGAVRKVAEVGKEVQQQAGDLARNRGKFEDDRFAGLPSDVKGDRLLGAMVGAREQKQAYEQAHRALQSGELRQVQTDKLGVDLSVQMNNLKNQDRLQQTALRRVANRNCLEIGGIWVDEGFDPKQPMVVIKAMSEAYFRLLERQPQVREVLQLGNHLIWVTPNGTALVIDTNDGQAQMTDAEIDRLFAAK